MSPAVFARRAANVSDLRYGITMRRGGKPLLECQGVGYGKMPCANRRPERSGRAPQFARAGLIIIKGGFDLFAT